MYNFAIELKNVANERKSLISSGIMKLGGIRNRISEMLNFKHFGHVSNCLPNTKNLNIPLQRVVLEILHPLIETA